MYKKNKNKKFMSTVQIDEYFAAGMRFYLFQVSCYKYFVYMLIDLADRLLVTIINECCIYLLNPD